MYYSSFLFCFKQKTAYEMRISDWSSDVCSSDLHEPGCEGLILLRGGSPQFFLSDAEIARDSLSVPFRETPGDAALDELLDIGGIATDQPRDRGIILSLCADQRSEEHTSELQSLMRISYAVFCLKQQKNYMRPGHNTST